MDHGHARVSLHHGWLRVEFAAAHADFHYRWLRHNSDGDRHPRTGERLLCSSELPDQLWPISAIVDREDLRVVWNDRPGESRYPLGWLREHAYARDRVAAPPPPADLGAIEIHAARTAGETAAAALTRVRRDGIVVVRGANERPPEAETEPLISAFERLDLRVIETHFGRIEDLRPDNTTNKNTDQLGYTDSAIQLHTDQPFLDHPPRYQILQAIRAADAGGESFFVDALAAARYFAALDEAGHALLATTPVHFHRQQRAFASSVVAPILALDGPRGFQIRYSYFTMAPHQVPFERMSAWYRAHDDFARLVRDPRHQLRFKLEPGDFVLYDNLRMLHARTGFTGPRWVRGIYLDA